MEYINFITKIICYGINAILLLNICTAQFDFKKHKKKLLPSVILVLSITIEFGLVDNTYLRALSVLITTLLFEIIMLEGNIRMKLLPPCIFGMVYGVASLVNIYMLSFLFEIDIETIVFDDFLQSLVLISETTLILPFMFGAMKFLKKHCFEQKEWVVSALVFLINGIVSILVTDISIKNGLSNVIDIRSCVIPLVILIENVINSLCIMKLNRHYNYKIESDVIKTRLQGDKEMLEKMESLYEKSRIIRHDMKHYLTVVAGLIQEENYEEAKKFIDNVLGMPIFSPVIYYMGSKLVNAVLNNKQGECDLKGISFDMRIVGNIPKDKDMEVSIILSNLLDNAIEAQEELNDKEIFLDMYEHKGMYYFVVKNKIKESVLEKNPFLDKSSKANKTDHGIGMLSVKKMVSDMDGSLQWYEEKGHFIIYVGIPVNA